MEKTIKDFTDKFLTYSRLTIFILLIMANFNWYDSTDPMPGYVALVLNLIGGVSTLSWIYAVGHKANQKLLKRKITLDIFKYFNLGIMAIIGSVLAMFLLSEGSVSHGDPSFNITYTRPLEIALFFLASLIFTVFVASKVLVSAEKNKEAKFEDYVVTLLLFGFLWIGIWFIQPRVQKL